MSVTVNASSALFQIGCVCSSLGLMLCDIGPAPGSGPVLSGKAGEQGRCTPSSASREEADADQGSAWLEPLAVFPTAMEDLRALEPCNGAVDCLAIVAEHSCCSRPSVWPEE